MLEIGYVAKAQGIKGEIKVNLELDAGRVFAAKTLLIAGNEYSVERIENRVNGVILKLKGVDDRTTAESLQNEKIFAHENELEKLKENEFYFADLLGASVVGKTSGENFGEIEDIDQFGSADVIYVRKDNIVYSLPFVDDIFLQFDKTSKTFYVDEEKYNNMKIFD